MENGSDAVIKDIRVAAETVSANDDDDFSATPLHEIESLCMRCGENGITRILLTRIPHFREVVLMAFECPHCNERNNEIQFAGDLRPRGCFYELKVPSGDAAHEALEATTRKLSRIVPSPQILQKERSIATFAKSKDLEVLNRQVVKSDSATIRIPELEFEIPPEAQRGKLSTVEGILLRAAVELQALQDERKKVDLETAEAIDRFLVKLRSYAAGESSFTFILDDPAGNSFVENPSAPSSDPLLAIRFYERTREQQAALGFLVDHPEASAEENNLQADERQNAPHGSVGAVAGRRAIALANPDQVAAALCRYSAPEEVDTLPSSCGACAAACVTRFYATKIPYFREVIVMASACDLCGYRSSELKPGGEIPKMGKKITLSVRNIEDLSRDVIKSDTAAVEVPELDLELASGTLGGMVTTVEGLITKISESLERVHGFQLGDSTEVWKIKKWQDFQSRLLKLLGLEEPWTLVLDDAMASSFVSPITDDIEDDKQLVVGSISVEDYERSWEQNEELGLNDMDTSSADNAYNTATHSTTEQ